MLIAPLLIPEMKVGLEISCVVVANELEIYASMQYYIFTL
jgi:hypothetical protein